VFIVANNNTNKLADPEIPSLIQELGTAHAQVGLKPICKSI